MKRKLLTALLSAALGGALLAPGIAQADFGFAPGSFDVTYTDAAGAAVTQAGSHRFEQTTAFEFNTAPNPIPGVEPEVMPDGAVKHQVFGQIPGFVGNNTAVTPCTQVEFAENRCPDASQVGWAQLALSPPGSPFPPFHVGVYNMVPSPGMAATLGFYLDAGQAFVEVIVNPKPPHNLIAAVRYISQALPVYGTRVTLWAVPADPAHDDLRGNCIGDGPGGAECPAGVPERAWLTVPRSCKGPLETTYEINSWQQPGSWLTGSVTTHDELGAPVGFDGCEILDFKPSTAAAPTTNVADSPSGFDFSISIEDPGLTGPDGPAGSDLKQAVVTLPRGLTVNPASAGGLAACSEAELAREDYDSAPGAGCPQASKLATVAVETPLLHERLSGAVYLATPHRNPFGSLLAGYLVIRQPQRGIIIKLPGRIEADPATGQLTASFDQNPELPFGRLEVSFPPGPRASLITPQACGSYETRTELYPHADPDSPVVQTDSFQIVAAPGGGPCPNSEAELPHSPGFDAGSTSPLAGRHSPFVVNLRREDGSQRFSTVKLTPPPGLTAKLAGTPACPDAALAAAAARAGRAEQASPSCPAASRIGTVWAAAGAGPAPYWAQGHAYLAGPYKGAPLSMAILTPAVAGPFDLGTVVIRNALHVDPRTAQITAVSDPIPEMLEGIPLDVRVASIRLDKPGFALNGTSCDPLAITGQLASTLGALAPLHNRFQLGECTRLGFKPRLRLRLFGKRFSRGSNVRLRAVALPRPGDANIGRTAVKMPSSLFIDQSHIRTVCTRVQFAAERCPKGSVYGSARAFTPLLDHPLQGPVYLRSSDNPLPDLVADLKGPAHQPIRVELVGRTDSVKGALRNVFSLVPDAPVSRFELMLQGGGKSLLVASRNLCRGPQRARVDMAAQNGVRRVFHQPIAISRCGKERRAAKHRKAAKRRGAKRASLSVARPGG